LSVRRLMLQATSRYAEIKRPSSITQPVCQPRCFCSNPTAPSILTLILHIASSLLPSLLHPVPTIYTTLHQAASRLPSLTSFCRNTNISTWTSIYLPHPYLRVGGTKLAESTRDVLGFTYQRLHSPVERVSVVSSELGICAIEGRVAVSFRLLNPRCAHESARAHSDRE
jgi:hypothetical protein